ncbi:hypothetical protein GW17_00038242 [Ensete ventricosum]|nr:hypothetical protein GW17_00038242 [Ensete ventricosum]
MRHPRVTRDCVGEGELLKEQTQSKVAEALRCAGRGHTWRNSTGELDSSSAYIRLREPDKSEDKADYPKAKRRLEIRWTRRSATVP